MPHDAASLARKTRLPRAIFEAVLPRLLSIGWLEQVLDTTGDIEMSQEDAMPPQEGAGIPQDSALEGKGREGKVKGREKGKSAPQNDLEPLPPEAFDIAKKLNIPPALLVLRYKARRDPIWILAALLRTADRAHQMPALKSPQAYFARLCRDEEPPNDAALEEAGLIVKGWRSRQNQDAIPAMPKAVQEAIGKGESQ